MSKWILSLMAIVVFGAATSCEKSNDDKVSDSGVKHYFGGVVEVEADKTDATIIAIMPRMTVDGYDNPKAKIKLGYEAHMGDLVGEEQFQDEYGVRDSLVVFKLSKLAPMTEYTARIYIEDERYDYSATSEDFTFSTSKRDVVCEANCDINVEARGLFATITLDNITLTADGEPHPMRGIEVEYRRGVETSSDAWVEMVFAPEDIVDGRLVVELPAEGEKHLAFSNSYDYVIRFLPEQSIIPEEPLYQPCILTGEFETTNAEVVVDFATPTLVCESLADDGFENDFAVTATLDKLDIFYDGVSSEMLKAENYIYIYDETRQLCHRPKGSQEWTREKIYRRDDGIYEMRFVLYSPAPDTIYESCFAVFPAGDHTTAHYSDIVEIIVNPSTTNQ